MHVLIVKLSSLGDVVHTMPVVHDILRAHPQARIDWVVEPGFASLVRRVHGVQRVIECPLRRWSRSWWRPDVWAECARFRRALRAQRYDAVLDLQGLTKSALIARLADGVRYGLGNRTDGASFEAPARWLVDHPIVVQPHIHALDRARSVAASALGYAVQGPPDFGLGCARSVPGTPTLVFVHGTSRDDKLWPEADWIEFGRRVLASGWHVALPHAGAIELARAQRIQAALGACAQIWPAMDLAAMVDRLASTQGVVGVDSGLSHIAVALGLPHLQLYNWPTAWRTGPLRSHGHLQQRAIEGRPAPTVQAVWDAWCEVRGVAPWAG